LNDELRCSASINYIYLLMDMGSVDKAGSQINQNNQIKNFQKQFELIVILTL